MLPPCEAILFDFDGTLAVQTLDFVYIRRRLWVLVEAQQALPLDYLRPLDILEMLDHATALLQEHQPEGATLFAQDAQQLLQDLEVEAARSSRLLPGIQELLVTLQHRRIGVGVVTRNCEAAVRLMFPHIDTYCQAFLPRDRVAQVKPHPGHLQAALTCLGVMPHRALMVGDGGMDMQAGKALGMFCVGVLSGSGTRTSLRQHGADMVLESAAELLHYLPDARGLQS